MIDEALEHLIKCIVDHPSDVVVSSKNDVVKEFFTWILETYGPANAEALGYAPLTGELEKKALALAKTISTK